MPDFFNSPLLALSAVPETRTIPGRIRVNTPDGAWEPIACLITGVDLDADTLHSFQPSLDRKVWLYRFGDRMGQIVVNGLAFPARCGGEGLSADAEAVSKGLGISEILDLYMSHRLSVTPLPIQVEISTETISGYITGLKLKALGAAEDPASFASGFSLMIAVPPKPTEESQQSGGGSPGDAAAMADFNNSNPDTVTAQ